MVLVLLLLPILTNRSVCNKTLLYCELITAKVAVELAKQELVKALVLLHPSRVTVDDIKGNLRYFDYDFYLFTFSLTNW